MTSTTHIAASIERLETTVSRRPGFGVGTSTASTVSSDGLRCTTDDGPWSVVADLPTVLGGEATAPSPSVLLRAAFGSCMAMSYRLRAARHGVDVGVIRVVVETDSALAGMLLAGAEVPAGFTGLRYHVDVESGADADDVARIVAEGDRLSPLHDTITRPLATYRTLTVTRGG